LKNTAIGDQCASPKVFQFAVKRCLQFGLGRQVQLIPACENFILLLGAKGVFDHGIVFVRAKHQPEGWIVACRANLAVEMFT